MSVQPSLGHLHLQTPLSGKKKSWMLDASLSYSTEVSSLLLLLLGPGSPLRGHRTNLIGPLHANPLFKGSLKMGRFSFSAARVTFWNSISVYLSQSMTLAAGRPGARADGSGPDGSGPASSSPRPRPRVLPSGLLSGGFIGQQLWGSMAGWCLWVVVCCWPQWTWPLSILLLISRVLSSSRIKIVSSWNKALVSASVKAKIFFACLFYHHHLWADFILNSWELPPDFLCPLYSNLKYYMLIKTSKVFEKIVYMSLWFLTASTVIFLHISL